MFRPSSGALKFGGSCCAFRATAIRVFVFTVFLNEVNAVPASVKHVSSSFGVPVSYQLKINSSSVCLQFTGSLTGHSTETVMLSLYIMCACVTILAQSSLCLLIPQTAKLTEILSTA
jgi:hypothetical protein